MRPTLISTLALVFSLIGAPLAQASPPSALARAEQAAIGYWGEPSCGRPQIVVSSSIPWPEEGMSLPWDCRAFVSQYVAARADIGPRQYFELCRVVAHEWGHLTLGEDYFSASNPNDSAHSPDMGNLMYAYLGTTTPQCLSSMPTTATIHHRAQPVRVSVRGGMCLAENRRLEFYEGWPCVTTNAVSVHPAPESATNLRRLLAVLVFAD